MCESYLIVNGKVTDPDLIDWGREHNFAYEKDGKRTTLLKLGKLDKVKVDHAACHKIENQFGVKKGYIFVIGEKD